MSSRSPSPSLTLTALPARIRAAASVSRPVSSTRCSLAGSCSRLRWTTRLPSSRMTSSETSDSKQRRTSTRKSGTASRGFMGTARAWVASCIPASRVRSARTLAYARLAQYSTARGTSQSRIAWGTQAAVAEKITPKARLTVQPIREPGTIAGARSASTALRGCCLAISSTATSAMRLTTDTASMATTSAHRLSGPRVPSGRSRWNTKLPAAAALIHWATLKQALVGWMRCRDSDSPWARATTSTTVRGGSRKIAGARTASNRSRASPWSRNWISTVGEAGRAEQDQEGGDGRPRTASRPPRPCSR